MNLRALLPLLLLCALSACGGGPHRAVTSGGPANYAPPGPPEDPWGPYISEASGRFDVPQPWIRTVMRQESGGHQYLHGQPIRSDAGAVGLMQILPTTYAELSARYGLGPDPYEPHDNIVAGTGYIRELYDRYGAPAFLAAYDAGPHRLEAYLAGHSSLPNETVNYLASTAPYLGNEKPLSGPLIRFASASAARGAGRVPHDYVMMPNGCLQDRNAAYDPQANCRSRSRPVMLASAAPRSRAPVRQCWQDPNAAYDPTAPCRSAPPAAPVQVAQAPLPAPAAPVQVAEAPPPRATQPHYASNFLIPTAAAATVRPAAEPGRWAIQVGAFSNADQARRAADSVRSLAPAELGAAHTALGTTEPFGGKVLYRARLAGLSSQTASAACGRLQAHSHACVIVPPGG